MRLSRRTFIAGAGISALALAAGSKFTTDIIEQVEQTISSPRLPAAFDGYRIGFLSDIHLGVWTPEAWLEEALSWLSSRSIDLLLLGGDFLWIPDTIESKWFRNYRNPKYSQIPKKELPGLIYQAAAERIAGVVAKDGTFAVMGNHDHWVAPWECTEKLAANGIKILINDLVKIKRNGSELHLYGMDDYWTGLPKVPREVSPALANEFRLGLTHNPDLISQALTHSPFNFDLVLAGHTHGGQVHLPVLGTPFYNVEDNRFRSGLYSGARYPVYTSRGLGVVELPYRINCPAEVTVVTLRRA